MATKGRFSVAPAEHGRDGRGRNPIRRDRASTRDVGLSCRPDNWQVPFWTMNADGTGQTQLTPTPVAADWVGEYAWWPPRGR